MTTYQSRLSGREEVAEGTMAFHLEKPAGFQFKAGQYVDISSTPTIEAERAGIVPDAVVLELYQKMLTVFYVEERLKIFDRLGRVSFHASVRGHEKLQIGMTLLLKPRQDWFFTYYREKGIAIGLGMPLKMFFWGC